MALEINAIMTDDGRLFWARLFAGIAGYTAPVYPGGNPKLTHFKIGEGGWEDLGAGPVARTASSSLRYETGLLTGLHDLDAAVDAFRVSEPQRYAPDSRFTFLKALAPGDVTVALPGTITVNCGLLAGECNLDGFGNPPELWEIGIFGDHPTSPGNKLMVAYGTFPKVTKAAIVYQNIVRIYF